MELKPTSVVSLSKHHEQTTATFAKGLSYLSALLPNLSTLLEISLRPCSATVIFTLETGFRDAQQHHQIKTFMYPEDYFWHFQKP